MEREQTPTDEEGSNFEAHPQQEKTIVIVHLGITPSEFFQRENQFYSRLANIVGGTPSDIRLLEIRPGTEEDFQEQEINNP